MTETESKIVAIATTAGIEMVAQFVPWSRSRNAKEKTPSLNWSVTLRKVGRETGFLTTEYMAGCGHCPSYKQGRQTYEEKEAIKAECETGRASGRTRSALGKRILPDFANVLASLCSEADALNYGNFEEWAESLGYDTDSRKAEATYRACLEIGLKLRNAMDNDTFTRLCEACREL